MTEENHITAVVSKHPIAERRTLRAIAIFEAFKGFAALASGIGLLSLMRHDVRHLAVELIGRFGLNPSAHYSSILLHYADIISDANVRLVVLLASGYIILRFVEAYGLWNDLVWGEWLGALSGGLYIPFEVLHLVHRPSLVSALVLIGNVFVVGFLAYELWRRRGRSQKLLVP